MRLTGTFVGRSTWTVVVCATLLLACSGGDDGLENAATTERPPPIATRSTPESATGTTPPPATTAATSDGTMPTTRSATMPTTTTGDQVAPAAWEPIDPASGNWLAFTSERTGSRELFAIDTDTGDERQLTDQVGDVYQPAWSPDGSMVAFQCPSTAPPVGMDPDSGVGPSDICTVAVATGEVAFLTHDVAPDQSPVWSPDSSQVAFITIGDGDVQVRSISIGDGEPRVVAQGLAPAWSPDGSELAVVGTTGELAVVDVRSGEQRPLADTGTLGANPMWSPDGDAIAFSCVSGEPGPDDPMPPTDICVITADGSEQRALADGGSADSDPAWSPDGAAIVFVSSELLIARTEIVIARIAGGSPEPIGSGYSPEWSPDGSSLAIVATTGGIQLIDAETGTITQVSVDSTVGEPTWAPTG